MVSILFKWLLTGAMLISAAGGSVHPIYMSVTEIEHNAKEKTLEISCRIFTNDLETTLRQTNKGFIDLINPKDKAATNKLVNDYIQKHLSIVVDGKTVALQFLGYEQQEDAINSFYQVNNIATVKKITITDNILYEYKSEQISLLHVTVDGNRKSTKMINPEEKTSLEF
jgi:hypothetical protein